MISFKQLESGAPKDIEVTTDDSDAEMAAIEEVLKEGEFEETETWTNFNAAERQEDGGNFVFVIPGDEVGEVADYYMPLAEAIEDFNAKAIAGAEEESGQRG